MGSEERKILFVRTMKSAEPLPEVLLYDSRLMKTKTGHYHLFVPKPLEIRSQN